MATRVPTRIMFDDATPVGMDEAMDAGVSSSLGADALRDLGLQAWAERVPEPQGPMDFDRFRFQLPLYGERAMSDRELVVKKATQLGISAWALRWALYHADVRGRTGLYVMPTEKVLKDFSDHRIRETIRRSEYLRSRLDKDSINNRGMRQIGLGFVYFRGSTEATNLESIPADMLVLDEYDTLEQSNISVAESRVSGPLSEGLIRRVGVPSVPGFGISKLYESTTQHVWRVKCQACGEWQPIVGSETYAKNMDEARARLVCSVESCRRDLDVLHGEWVATYPERDTLGYWMTKFIVPGIDLRRVVTNHAKNAPADVQSHYNRDLGEEFAPAEGRLSRAAILACTRPGQIHLDTQYVGFNPITMGIDVASARAFNVRISEHLPRLGEHVKRALWIGTLEWPPTGDAAEVMRQVIARLGDLMTRYNVHMASIDHLPENRLAHTLAARFPGRVYVTSYATQQNPPPGMMTADDESMTVSVHRTSAIEATLGEFTLQHNLIPALDELPPEYVDHLGALIKVVERDEFDKVKTYYRSTGPDDYAQAEVYDFVATRMLDRRIGMNAVLEAQRSLTASRDGDDPPDLDEDEDDGRLDEGDYSTGREWQ